MTDGTKSALPPKDPVGVHIALVVAGPVLWRPSFFRSRVVSRFAWLWFSLKVIHVSEHEFSTTAYDWIDQ